MPDIDWLFAELLRFNIIALTLLSAGVVALRSCRQPLERIRLIQISLAAIFIAAALAHSGSLPTIDLAWLPANRDSQVSSDVDRKEAVAPESGPVVELGAEFDEMELSPVPIGMARAVPAETAGLGGPMRTGARQQLSPSRRHGGACFRHGRLRTAALGQESNRIRHPRNLVAASLLPAVGLRRLLAPGRSRDTADRRRSRQGRANRLQTLRGIPCAAGEFDDGGRAHGVRHLAADRAAA